MHFKLRSHNQLPHFYPYQEYKIENQELAELMVKHSLNRMYEVNLFGNGYPVSPPRDYPHMIAEENYTIVYDSSHVEGVSEDVLRLKELENEMEGLEYQEM